MIYNDVEDTTTLRLSDAFALEHRGEADIEVTVRMVNINRGHSQPMMVTAQGSLSTIEVGGNDLFRQPCGLPPSPEGEGKLTRRGAETLIID